MRIAIRDARDAEVEWGRDPLRIAMAARGEDEAHKATLGATPREAELEICRQPSVLRELIGEERPHGRPTWSYKPDTRSGGSRSSSASSGSIPEICTEESDSSVLRWSKEEVAAWLAEIGFPQYEVRDYTCVHGQRCIAAV